MSRRDPKNKGAATITARQLTALAADLKQAAEGFEAAARLFRAGDNAEAREYADGALSLALSVLNIWHQAR